ncbi:hypothetical protein BJ138DRAFT_1106508 [Hygrophoropsis aurantiaca]|uniref:Uncharacterized protein n=1 Tax=Hygrophoropsis aurantiaca TaxID=72124 RepID=A0ACB7ZUH3_9AGAM|nr:hypothetical protein BJ138DRAFT_1106508 [Hygrophoropsis aurantiaca]
MSKGLALVTGAAQGMGQAIALQLANNGFDVALNDIPAKKEQLDTVAQEVNATGHKALVVTVEELGGLDVMVANAGISGLLGPLVDSSTEAWDKLFAINARGVYLCYKHAAKQMIAQGRGGRIIGASSAAGKRASELGKHGITVNSYVPGIIDTPMLHGLEDQGDRNTHGGRHHWRLKWEQSAVAATPAGYTGKPEDIAGMVSYLASKEAHFVAGQSVR